MLDEGTLRQVTTRDVAAGGQQFDVVMIGLYEAPQFGQNGSLVDLTPFATKDSAYQIDDIIPSVRKGLSVDDKLYASPFYAESSFLMYRKDLLKKAGVEMPAKPTWQEVADIARKVDSPDTAGICLRGKPGWGDLGAALTTVREHLRRHLVERERRRVRGRGAGQPARVQAGARVLHGPDRGRRRGGCREHELQRVPGAVQGRQGGHVVRRHRRRRPARGRRQPGEGQERLRPRSGRRDRLLGLAVGVVARDPHDDAEAGPGVEVRLVRHRPRVHQAGRARRSTAAGRRSRPARASRPTRSPSTRRRPPRSPTRRWRRWPRRRSTTRGRRRVPACRACSSSGSPSSRTSATSAPSSSRP